MLRAFVTRNPDEAEGWYQLSDFLYHLFDIRSGSREEILDGRCWSVSVLHRGRMYARNLDRVVCLNLKP